MPVVVVDTDVVSFRFKKDTRARLYKRHQIGQHPLIAFMTLAELHAWAPQRRWGEVRPLGSVPWQALVVRLGSAFLK